MEALRFNSTRLAVLQIEHSEAALLMALSVKLSRAVMFTALREIRHRFVHAIRPPNASQDVDAGFGRIHTLQDAPAGAGNSMRFLIRCAFVRACSKAKRPNADPVIRSKFLKLPVQYLSIYCGYSEGSTVAAQLNM
jgi:hypothetical protein